MADLAALNLNDDQATGVNRLLDERNAALDV